MGRFLRHVGGKCALLEYHIEETKEGKRREMLTFHIKSIAVDLPQGAELVE